MKELIQQEAPIVRAYELQKNDVVTFCVEDLKDITFPQKFTFKACKKIKNYNRKWWQIYKPRYRYVVVLEYVGE